MKIEELSLEEKIGQLFMVGLNEKSNDEITKLVQENKIGGVVLYRKNYSNYREMINFVNNIKMVSKQNCIPIFISIDQEGGRVNRMPQEIPNIKSAMKIAKTKNVKIAQKSGELLAKILKKTGISMNYAPVLDIKRFNEEHPIGDRCYGENKEDVIKYGIEVMKEMKKEGVISVIKHFPGHGLTKKDSHFKIPKITQKVEFLEQEDMLPFKIAIEEGADAIMVAHLILTQVDNKYPASLSKKVIKNYLIEKYNFKGLIITDDLKMMAVQFHYNMKKALTKAIEAGNDMVMIGLPYSKIKKLIKYLTKQVRKRKIEIERINKSVEKIVKLKQKYRINDEEIVEDNLEQIKEEIIKFNEKI